MCRLRLGRGGVLVNLGEVLAIFVCVLLGLEVGMGEE